MRIDPESLRSHYASVSDEELLSLYPDRAQLTEVAQKIYDEEIARRDLTAPDEAAPYGSDAPVADEVEDEAEEAEVEPGPEPDDDGPPPAWLEHAACAWAIAMRRHGGYEGSVASVRAALRAARIPNHAVVKPPEPQPPGPLDPEIWVMVPGNLGAEAANVLEGKVFNAWHEAEWRSQLHSLSDEELRAMKPEKFCAALLDKVERMKRAYFEEVASRANS